jgi:hypothetical protein
MPVFFIIITILIIIGFAVLGSWLAAKRRKELAAWSATKGLNFYADKDYSMEGRCPNFRAICEGENRYAYNIMEGNWLGQHLSAFDYHYETHSTDSKGNRQTHHHHFSAIVLGSELPLKNLFIRPEGFFDKITEFFGADDIDFESAEFSKKFYVKADDRKWAYDVIHARTMEFLLAQPRFTVQFGPRQIYVWRTTIFKIPDFESAIETAHGILERFPEYLVKQLKEGL